jgi:hypothetical protein
VCSTLRSSPPPCTASSPPPRSSRVPRPPPWPSPFRFTRSALRRCVYHPLPPPRPTTPPVCTRRFACGKCREHSAASAHPCAHTRRSSSAGGGSAQGVEDQKHSCTVVIVSVSCLGFAEPTTTAAFFLSLSRKHSEGDTTPSLPSFPRPLTHFSLTHSPHTMSAVCLTLLRACLCADRGDQLQGIDLEGRAQRPLRTPRPGRVCHALRCQGQLDRGCVSCPLSLSHHHHSCPPPPQPRSLLACLDATTMTSAHNRVSFVGAPH